MKLDLFAPIVPPEQQHPNFTNVVSEKDDSVRAVLRDWSEGFVDRDGKFVDEFQRTFNSSWWELYLFAVLKSLGIGVDFSFDAPDFVTSNAELAIEAVIASNAQDAKPEWRKTIRDVTRVDDISGRYLEALARLSNALDSKVRHYRKRYAKLSHMNNRAYLIAILNFGTPDAHQLGDVAVQRLLYDVWEEGSFPKANNVQLPTGLFLDERLSDVSGVLYSSVATFGKARALSKGDGTAVFQAIRIRNNIEPIVIAGLKGDYRESLRDGLRLFHNPNAKRTVPEKIFDVDDIRQFRWDDGEVLTTCHPDGDLCMRQVIRLALEGRDDA